MINNKRVIAVIPARAGSKAVPDKNVYLLGGKPLIAWPIETAKMTSEIDRIIVSTDGKKITETAQEYGAEVYDRSAELAGDTSLVIDTIRELIVRLREQGETAEYMVVLEATSPFRKPNDIRACLELLEKDDLDSSTTYTEPALQPNRAFRLENDSLVPYIDDANPWLPRQQLPPAWQLNGMVYAFNINRLGPRETSLLFGTNGGIYIPRSRSIDIDDELDFVFAEAMIMRNLI